MRIDPDRLKGEQALQAMLTKQCQRDCKHIAMGRQWLTATAEQYGTIMPKTLWMRARVLLLILVTMSPCLIAQTSKAQPRPAPPVRRQARVTSAHLQAVPARYNGACPTKVVFKGTITTDGPAEVKYTWASFDGGSWPQGTIKFTAAGTRPVNESRQISAAENGWMQLKVLAPNTLHSTEAKYTFTCRTPPKRK